MHTTISNTSPYLLNSEKTNGAMRHCFRMKKLATPPQHSSNHRFHNYGWSRASNYVAKAYMRRGQIDTSQEGNDAVLKEMMIFVETIIIFEENGGVIAKLRMIY